MLQLSMRRAADLGVYRVKRVLADESEHASLDEQFLIRSASDVAAQLGEMKGAIMKAGQMLSFIADGLPGPAKEALAQLQADVPPMAPELARQVIERCLGAPPHELFAEWSEMPIAAASIGQVHKARLHDGRDVAVKVQYPGVGDAISTDLNNAERMYSMFSAFALGGLVAPRLAAQIAASNAGSYSIAFQIAAVLALMGVLLAFGYRLVNARRPLQVAADAGAHPAPRPEA